MTEHFLQAVPEISDDDNNLYVNSPSATNSKQQTTASSQTLGHMNSTLQMTPASATTITSRQSSNITKASLCIFPLQELNLQAVFDFRDQLKCMEQHGQTIHRHSLITANVRIAISDYLFANHFIASPDETLWRDWSDEMLFTTLSSILTKLQTKDDARMKKGNLTPRMVPSLQDRLDMLRMEYWDGTSFQPIEDFRASVRDELMRGKIELASFSKKQIQDLLRRLLLTAVNIVPSEQEISHPQRTLHDRLYSKVEQMKTFDDFITELLKTSLELQRICNLAMDMGYAPPDPIVFMEEQDFDIHHVEIQDGHNCDNHGSFVPISHDISESDSVNRHCNDPPRGRNVTDGSSHQQDAGSRYVGLQDSTKKEECNGNSPNICQQKRTLQDIATSLVLPSGAYCSEPATSYIDPFGECEQIPKRLKPPLKSTEREGTLYHEWEVGNSSICIESGADGELQVNSTDPAFSQSFDHRRREFPSNKTNRNKGKDYPRHNRNTKIDIHDIKSTQSLCDKDFNSNHNCTVNGWDNSQHYSRSERPKQHQEYSRRNRHNHQRNQQQEEARPKIERDRQEWDPQKGRQPREKGRRPQHEQQYQQETSNCSNETFHGFHRSHTGTKVNTKTYFD